MCYKALKSWARAPAGAPRVDELWWFVITLPLFSQSTGRDSSHTEIKHKQKRYRTTTGVLSLGKVRPQSLIEENPRRKPLRDRPDRTHKKPKPSLCVKGRVDPLGPRPSARPSVTRPPCSPTASARASCGGPRRGTPRASRSPRRPRRCPTATTTGRRTGRTPRRGSASG